MALMSLKDYAAINNVTYEAVRQQVVRYAEELGDHIIKEGRQQFLDEEAIAFLDGKRQKNPVTIIQTSKDEEIERLKQEKENLLIKIATQADRISELSDWKADKAVLIARAEQQTLLLEEKEKQVDALKKEMDQAEEKHQEELKAAIKEADDLEIANQELQRELETERNKKWYHKIFRS